MKKYINILQKYFTNDQISHVLDCWREPHRRWHSIEHLIDLFNKVDKIKGITEKEYEILIIAVFFHDVVYDPQKRDNEIRSIELFDEYSEKVPNDYCIIVTNIINCTALYPEVPLGKLCILFWKMDNDIVINKNFYEFIDYEDKIRKEYSFISTPIYKENRMKFLEKYIGLVDDSVDEYIKKCIDYVSNLY
jgi:predicted metal-dependent HD superfamily phosphohydrolase